MSCMANTYFSMSNEVAIRVESLGKRYRYGGAAPVGHNLRADIMNWARGLWPRNRRSKIGDSSSLQSPNSSLQTPPSPLTPNSQLPSSPATHESLKQVHERHLNEAPDYFWALRDINLEVRQGEVVGIIGRNGAGKSTLLKILSRITPPTTGEISYQGRIASLLEVGTGFSRELTGRENIFLNGSILGMRRREIHRKLDEIVAFAEVEKFLDTPVKFYSSGMYVRLAFAVAAHLEPETLVIDEVLAVGDAAFQKKCLGKMSDVAKQGRTVLFVSHNMAAVNALCSRAVWLNAGQTLEDGKPEAVIRSYIERVESVENSTVVHHSEDGDLDIEKVLTKDDAGTVTNSFQPGDPLTVEIQYFARRPVRSPYLWIDLSASWGVLLSANALLDGIRPEVLDGKGCLRCRFDHLPLLPQQTYGISLGGRNNDGATSLLKTAEVAHFRVVGTAQEAGLMGEPADHLVGGTSGMILPYQWELPNGETVRCEGFRKKPR